MWQWEGPEDAFERVRHVVDPLFLAVERAAAEATDLFYDQGLDRRRFPHAWCDMVRTLVWSRDLDHLIEAEEGFYAWSEGNAGIAALTGQTTIRVLHEHDGGLPPAQSDARRAFYCQPAPNLWTDPAGPRRIEHLVALWGYEPLAGLRMRLIAPRNHERLHDPIWEMPVTHPYERAEADLPGVTRLHDAADEVDEIQPLREPAADDPADELEPNIAIIADDNAEEGQAQ